MGDVIDLDAYRARRKQQENEKRWRKKDEELEAYCHRRPPPSCNLGNGNRWVRPKPAGSTWPGLDFD